MPPPAEPFFPSVTADLSAQEAAVADPDFLCFLRHVRLDGGSYAVVLPSEDGAASPPLVIRYEQPLPDRNAGTPVAGSNCGGKGAPPLWEENPWAGAATSEAEAAPHGVKRKAAPDASPGAGGEVPSGGAGPMEEDMPTPVAESAWFEQPDIDEDYQLFLRHVNQVEGKSVFKMGNCSITIGEAPSIDHTDAEEDNDTEDEEWEEDDDTEEEEWEEEDDDEVDNSASGQSGEDGISTEEKDDEEEAIPVLVTEVKEEEVSEEDDNDVGPGTDLQIVNGPVYYCYERKNKKVEEGQKPLNALVRGTTDLDPLDKKEASSSKGHLAIPLNTSELQGIIWPPHINERPNSVFKEKLIECLIKPFTQEEYDKYLALATDRSPLLKERRTRNNVAYYPWTHELNKSYFDSFPDLAEQFSLQRNNYPNGLALLRGLFFWLQNIALEDQFMPWSSVFKEYRVEVVY